MLTECFKLFQKMILPELSRMIKSQVEPRGTTWNQVTKQETVVEREKKRRSGQSLPSPSLQQ